MLFHAYNYKNNLYNWKNFDLNFLMMILPCSVISDNFFQIKIKVKNYEVKNYL